jgi:hypothetical protein
MDLLITFFNLALWKKHLNAQAILYIICGTMPKENEKIVKLNILLKGDVADRFRRIKTFLGLENDTEVIRVITTWYYGQHEKDLVGPPKTMWHLNLNDNGVIIWDPDIQKGVQIHFKREGILCTHDEKDDCRHIQFALSKPDIKTIIRKRRKEGWNLPIV